MTKEEKEQRKLEKLEKKIQKQMKLNKFLTDVNDLLGEPNTNKTTYDFWGQEETKVEGYEPYQLEEEDDELEDDDLYEKGED